MQNNELMTALRAPFPIEAIEIKPGPTTPDKKRALALAYADTRVYQDRLDELVGIDGWQVEYRPLGSGALICRLSILGMIREDVGESDQGDPNKATIAVAQSFKRACAAFGLGRYLYSLNQVWADYDPGKKAFVQPLAIIQELYRQAGLIPRSLPASRPAARPSAPATAHRR